jgi:ribosomal protein L37AE/L43A
MKLVEHLQADFGQFRFVKSAENRWSAPEKTIFYVKNDLVGLLHELGHACLGHQQFTQDVELLHIERDAWEKAQEIGAIYGIKIGATQIEKAMDGYRDWLHARSTCPTCGQNGIQKHSSGHYRCPNCNTIWNTNDARKTALRRYKQA